MINLMRRESFERAKKIKLIVMDVDGVLTDGGIYIGENGELYKPFNVRDGLGINIALRLGFKFAIITGRKSKQLEIRAKELGINDVFQGKIYKRNAYNNIKEKFGLGDEEIAYVGDDLIDLPIMAQVGFPATVADAPSEVKNYSCVVSDLNGGRGAVREVIEFILKAQGLWQDIVNSYLMY